MSGSSKRSGWSVRSPHYPLVGAGSGRFEILGRLAVGGMAEVSLARDRTGEAGEVVIKRLLPSLSADEEIVAMFLDEARLGMCLHHPNVCRFYDSGQLAGEHWIAMEHIAGVTLEQLIRRAHVDGGMLPALGVFIVTRVAAALAHVHTARDEHGRRLDIVHRDISPRNVMVSWDGEVKLVDFGLARSRANRVVTGPGLAKGKFSYMSPEQYQGEPVDARSDIFALGVCLFELLTTTRLYRHATPLHTMNAIVSGPVPSLRSRDRRVPRSLDAIVQRALAKRPDDRFSSAGELEAVLEGWSADHSPGMSARRVAEHLEDLFHEELSRGPELGPATFSMDVGAPAARVLASPLPPRPARGLLRPSIAAGTLLVLAAATALAIPGADSSAARAIAPKQAAARVAAAERSLPQAERPEPEPAPSAPVTVEPAEPAIDSPRTRPIAAAPSATAMLSINTRPWSEVHLGGELLGITPLGDVSVPAGPLELSLVDAAGRARSHRITLPAGQHSAVFVDLDTGESSTHDILAE